jgi:hypothetical protein
MIFKTLSAAVKTQLLTAGPAPLCESPIRNNEVEYHDRCRNSDGRDWSPSPDAERAVYPAV